MRGRYLVLVYTVFVIMGLGLMYYNIYQDVVRDYGQYIYGSVIMIPIVETSNVTVVDSVDYVYRVGLGGGSGVLPIFAVSVNDFRKLSGGKQVVVIKDRGIDNKFGVLVLDSDIHGYYGVDARYLNKYSLPFYGAIYKNGTVFYVYDTKPSLGMYVIAGWFAWLLGVLFILLITEDF